MQFTSVSFLLFAAVLLALYYLCPKKARWVLLLAASWVFYLWAGVAYAAFLTFTTLSTYGFTRLMGANLQKQDAYLAENKAALSREEKKACKAKVKGQNRLLLTICLVANFAMLAVCKFCLAEPFRTAAQGTKLSFLTLGLPLGISFYLFQSMGYAVDVYRGTVSVERNFFKLALFTSYFPQLIQGPISQFSQLAPQLYALVEKLMDE